MLGEGCREVAAPPLGGPPRGTQAQLASDCCWTEINTTKWSGAEGWSGDGGAWRRDAGQGRGVEGWVGGGREGSREGAYRELRERVGVRGTSKFSEIH